MKVTFNILLVFCCCSAFVFSKGLDGKSKKIMQADSSVMMEAVKYSHGYGEFTNNEDVIERKRSHKRRKAVRKPRRGRGQ